MEFIKVIQEKREAFFKMLRFDIQEIAGHFEIVDDCGVGPFSSQQAA